MFNPLKNDMLKWYTHFKSATRWNSNKIAIAEIRSFDILTTVTQKKNYLIKCLNGKLKFYGRFNLHVTGEQIKSRT